MFQPSKLIAALESVGFALEPQGEHCNIVGLFSLANVVGNISGNVTLHPMCAVLCFSRQS